MLDPEYKNRHLQPMRNNNHSTVSIPIVDGIMDFTTFRERATGLLLANLLDSFWFLTFEEGQQEEEKKEEDEKKDNTKHNHNKERRGEARARGERTQQEAQHKRRLYTTRCTTRRRRTKVYEGKEEKKGEG